MKVITEHVTERLPARAGFMKTQPVRRLRRQHPRPARRRRPHAAVHAAGRRPARAVHRLRERRQPAPDARDRPQPRAGDPDDARRGAVADRAADADRGARDLASPARSAGIAVGLLGLQALIAMAGAADPRHARGDARIRSCSPFTFALAILTGLVFGIVPALAITRGNAAVVPEGRQPQRHRQPAHRRDARVPRRRRDDAGA